MTINIEWTRDDLKKVLIKKRMKTNVVIFILSFLLYLYITYYGFIYKEFDNIKLLFAFVIYLAIIMLFLFLTTKLYVHVRLKRNDKKTNMAYGKYVIKMDDEKILSSFNNNKISYKWKDIRKFKVRKNYFFIRTATDFIGLTFRRSELKDDYDKALAFAKSKITIQK